MTKQSVVCRVNAFFPMSTKNFLQPATKVILPASDQVPNPWYTVFQVETLAHSKLK